MHLEIRQWWYPSIINLRILDFHLKTVFLVSNKFCFVFNLLHFFQIPPSSFLPSFLPFFHPYFFIFMYCLFSSLCIVCFHLYVLSVYVHFPSFFKLLSVPIKFSHAPVHVLPFFFFSTFLFHLYLRYFLCFFLSFQSFPFSFLFHLYLRYFLCFFLCF